MGHGEFGSKSLCLCHSRGLPSLSNLIQLARSPTRQAGQERFHALGPIYYREADGALLVYDVTCADSLRKVRDWIRELNRMLGQENVRLAIVGNKADLLADLHSAPLVQEALQLADGLPNARHFLTSAKLDQGIGELFAALAGQMLERRRRRDQRARPPAGRLGGRALALARDEQLEQSEEEEDTQQRQQKQTHSGPQQWRPRQLNSREGRLRLRPTGAARGRPADSCRC